MAELTFYVPIFVWIFFNCPLLASASNVPLRKLLFVTTTLSYLNHKSHAAFNIFLSAVVHIYLCCGKISKLYMNSFYLRNKVEN